MLGALIVVAGAGAGWIVQPWVASLVRSRIDRPLPRGATRWISRPVLAIGSAAAGAVSFADLSVLLTATLVIAGIIAWWLLCVDAAIHRLPDPLVAALAAALSLGYLLLYVTDHASGAEVLRAGLAGAAAGAGFLILALSRNKAMGFGDVKLAGALGIGTGWFGWPVVGQWVVLSFIAGGLFAVAMLVARRVKSQDSIAFGPWLILGAAGAVAMNIAAGVPH